MFFDVFLQKFTIYKDKNFFSYKKISRKHLQCPKKYRRSVKNRETASI